MFKFVELMNTTNKRDRFKLMLFLKIVFNLYGKNAMNYSSLVSCVFVFTYMHIFYAILLINKYIFKR